MYGIRKSPSTDWKALEERSYKIMQKLGFKQHLLDEHLKEKNFLGRGGSKLTRADRQLISIGRVMVLNPEVIICNKPTSLLNDKTTLLALDMFKEFVDKRGVFMSPDEPLVLRRKRTILFSAKNEFVASKADDVYEARGGKLIMTTDPNMSAQERFNAITTAFKGGGENFGALGGMLGNMTNDFGSATAGLNKKVKNRSFKFGRKEKGVEPNSPPQTLGKKQAPKRVLSMSEAMRANEESLEL